MAIGTGTAILAGTIGGALLGSSASRSAAKTQARAAEQAGTLQKQVADEQVALQREQFERQVQLQEPFRQAGITALNKLVPLSTEYTPFGTQQFQQDPGYAFRLAEGQKALERSAAARGGLMSGAAGKALTRYGQEMGSQEYQNAFNRFQAERQARLNPLQSLAGVGQTSANVLGQAGQAMTAGSAGALGAYGAGASEALGAAGQARASGYVGGANAIGGAFNQYLNYQQNQAQNALLQQALSRSGGLRFGSGSGTFGEGEY